jgi:hypothetical protein
MKVGVLAMMILGALIAHPIGSSAGPPPEGDGDGVPDVLDNCLEVANAGALDCDTDQDGYGNACDCDLNNSGGCSATDLAIWKTAFKTVPQTNFNADHNCSGGISSTDLAIWKTRFKNTGTQFKSGLSCANPNVAGSCPN